MNKMHFSYLNSAKKILLHVRGKPLSLEERKKKAIELAALLLKEADKNQTYKEKKVHYKLARMVNDPMGKAFTISLADQSFRSKKKRRVTSQIIYLINQFGVPHYLPSLKKIQLYIFHMVGDLFSFFLIPIAKWQFRKESSDVILSAEKKSLENHIKKRKKEGIRLNINYLGEAVLGEEEAKHRQQEYLTALKNPDIDYISIKISTIFSMVNPLAKEETLSTLATRLSALYRAAMENPITKEDGSKCAKFINLDMEEYQDLHLTKELFKRVLSEPEFLCLHAGIVLQAYLPDTYPIQEELTKWAIERVEKGGAPIKVRLVKGANLSMEQVTSSIEGWAQAPYLAKLETDANFKKMLLYAAQKNHANAVHIGIGSHNLFDIAYALLIQSEQELEEKLSFEMLEGMAPHIQRVIFNLTKNLLLYCPVTTKSNFQNALAYLFRRLDENTNAENVLRHFFSLKINTKKWHDLAELFSQSCDLISDVPKGARRKQDPYDPPVFETGSFENESNTDFALEINRLWIEDILNKWKNKKHPLIPLVIAGEEKTTSNTQADYDPSYPGKALYYYSQASKEEIDQALSCAEKTYLTWKETSYEERSSLLEKVAKSLREKRGDLLGCLVACGGKTITEGDLEISEAIDFAAYYAKSLCKLHSYSDIVWESKGPILVASPWNFPIAIPCGGILAALAAGNTVIFKPAPEAVLCGWHLVNILWEAGIPKKVLQFINCKEEPQGSALIKDSRIKKVILTGSTNTARSFLKLRPTLQLSAETGGKNGIIVTSLADRDLAIKHIVASAFGHAGQKCSAASLLILESELYHDPHFLAQLKDATQTLPVGSSWDLKTKVPPLINSPNPDLLRGLTTLEKGEKWLLTPRQSKSNPNLWSPGIKIGVSKGSFMHQTELFGPLLGVMCAKNIKHAIELVNDTPYALTSGLHSLDEREHIIWLEKIEAGNCYINRTITGAVVQRQPFGGYKSSSFGYGAKAGGPNYISQFATPSQVDIPKEKFPIQQSVNKLSSFLETIDLSAEELGIWFASITNYSFWAKRFKHDRDPSKIIGQDNLFHLSPYPKIALRIQKNDSPIDLLRVIAGALSCNAKIEISWSPQESPLPINDKWEGISPLLLFTKEPIGKFLDRIKKGHYKRIRLVSPADEALKAIASPAECHVIDTPVLANGRFELLHYLRERVISYDYHRYGNLGIREEELRKPTL